MRRIPYVLSAALLAALLLPLPARAGDTLFQYSIIDALLAGLYDGQITLEQLKFQGDFGLGTLNGLDGELIVLDGQAYHAAAGGDVDIPADSTRSPFAVVSFFGEDTSLRLGRIGSLEELNRAVLRVLPSKNLFCAIRIDAEFPFVRVRAIPRQERPYKPLTEVAREQVVVRLSGEGTLVGYYSPAFVRGVNVPGFHWHFLTQSRAQGGHVLDCALEPADARLDILHDLTVRLPEDDAFDRFDLSGDRSGELRAVEQNTQSGK